MPKPSGAASSPNGPDGYLIGSYRIATAPEPNSCRLTSFKTTCFDSPANNVGPWPGSRPRRRSPRGLHHFVGDPAKEERIGPGDVLGRVTMQVFVRDHRTMIAAPVQGDVDGIPKGSHDVGSIVDC